jgi:hypothetical protein
MLQNNNSKRENSNQKTVTIQWNFRIGAAASGRRSICRTVAPVDMYSGRQGLPTRLKTKNEFFVDLGNL